MSLMEIQHKLKAPKSQLNKFGGYNYRSCEDILEAVKPLLYEYKYSIKLTDEVVSVGNRVYVKATAIIKDATGAVVESAEAFAREADTKKGMDESQITGAASSYARKYALNGLFAIDDGKDADSTNTHGQGNDINPPTWDDQHLRVDNLRRMAGLAGYDLTKLGTPLENATLEQRKKLYDILNAKLS